MTLPAPLQTAVAEWLSLAGAGRGGVRAASAALSSTYRAGGTSRDVDLGSYLVARLPATYAAADWVLAELVRRRPDFAPRSLLDAGCGPGTVSWAAIGLWSGLLEVSLLDSAPGMLDLAAALAGFGPPALAAARLVQGLVGRLPEGASADLVVASYVLAESPVEAAPAAALDLWAASRSALVLIEPGTPQGFRRLRAARDVLLAQGAVPVAPCPHASTCPMVAEDWCHFSVRLARSRAHMHAKAAKVPFEDEPFAYLIVAREGRPSGGARIVAPPRHAKPGIDFMLCVDGALQSRQVARRDGAAYRHAKKLALGDMFLPPVHPENEA
jgi:ribosomal protein RSM22 (predicted rRNA methylase)